MMAAGPKIPYTRWQYGRMLLGQLRNGKNLSLTEVSRMVKGNGDTPGWAASAMEHRGVMGENDITAMEALLVEKPSGMGRQPGDSLLNTDQREEFKRKLKRLRHDFGWSKQEIADALGYGSLSAVDKALQHGGGTVNKLTALSQIVNTLGTNPPPEEAVKHDDEPNITLTPPKKVAKATGLEAQLSTVSEKAYAFLEELMKLEEFLPVFAKAPLLDYQQRVEAIITELGAPKK